MAALTDKVVILTGAGRGIGLAQAHAFARSGAHLVLCDSGCDVDGTGNDPSIVGAAAEAIAGAAGEVVTADLDLTADGAAQALVELAQSRLGRVDAVVHGAGIHTERGLLHLGVDDLRRFLAIHLEAALALTQHASRAMIEQGDGGAILHTTAPSAFFGAARRTAAAAAAAAVVGLTRTAAVELRKHRIRVNAIAPTARTRATEHLPMFQGIREGSMSPEHVAPVAAFLISDRAEEVTGQVIGVAGGRVYAIRAREATGAFSEGRPFTIDEIEAAWDEIVRG